MSLLRLAGRQLLACLMLLGPCPIEVAALLKNRLSRTVPLVVFDFECTKPSSLSRARLRRQIRAALTEVGDIGVRWGNRAFEFDLNRDGKPEYFVPLECGATGNCSWGIFTTSPSRLIGVVNAQDIYVVKTRHGWSDIETYVSSSASDGYLQRYGLRRGRYRQISRDYYASAYLNNFPKSLDKVQLTCDPGYKPASDK
jgi:hypothetical protein